MQDLFIAKNKHAQKMEQTIGLGAVKPAQVGRTRSLSPSEAGKRYGKFIPSPTGYQLVEKMDGSVVKVPLTRRERRRLRNAK